MNRASRQSPQSPNFIPILLGPMIAAWFGVNAGDTLQGLDRNVIAERVYKTKAVLRKIEERPNFRRGVHLVYHLDNPVRPGQAITFRGLDGSPSVGDLLCLDVYVGQFGGVWTAPPTHCPAPAPAR